MPARSTSDLGPSIEEAIEESNRAQCTYRCIEWVRIRVTDTRGFLATCTGLQIRLPVVRGTFETSMSRARSDHLVPLDGGWSLWRFVCLRGAGFAAEGVLDFAVRDLDAYSKDAASARGEAA